MGLHIYATKIKQLEINGNLNDLICMVSLEGVTSATYFDLVRSSSGKYLYVTDALYCVL
jgi:hypothetical protein